MERSASAPEVTEADSFRTLAESIPALCWLAGPDGAAYWGNARYRAFFAGTQAMHGDGGAVVHPRDWDRAAAAWRHALATGEPLEMPLEIRGRDGVYRPFVSRATPIRDAAGAVVRWCGTMVDLSDQHARDRHAAFFRALSEAIRTDTDAGHILGVVAEMLKAHLAIDRVIYLEVDDAADGIALSVSRGPEANAVGSAIGRYRFDEGFAPLLAAWARGETTRCADAAALDALNTPAVQAFMREHGIQAALDVPLVKDGRLVAVLMAHHGSPRAWAEDERALVEDVAERTWSTVSRARAEAALLERERHQAFLIAWNDRVRGETDVDRIVDTTLAMLGHHYGATRATFSQADTDTHVVTFTHDWTETLESVVGLVLPLDELGPEIAALTMTADDICIHDVAGDPALPDIARHLYARTATAAIIGAPLRRDGVVPATISVQQDRPRKWTGAEMQLLRDLAERTWTVLERARAEAEVKARQRDQAFLIAWSDAVRGADVLQTTLDRLGAYLGASRVTYSDIEVDGGHYAIVAEWGPGEAPVVGYSYPSANLSETVRAAYLAGEALVSDDLAADARFSAEARRRFTENRVASRIGVPLTRGGEVRSILAVDQNAPRRWHRREVALVREVADRLWGMLERARAEADLKARERDQALLLAWSDRTRGMPTPGAIMAATLELLCAHLGCARATYSESDASGRLFTILGDRCAGVASIAGTSFSLDDVGAIVDREWSAGAVVRYDDVARDPRVEADLVGAYREAEIAAFVSIPIVQDGKVRAALSVQASTPRRWTDAEIALIRAFADRTWIALGRARVTAELRQRERDQAFLIGWSDLVRHESSAREILTTTLDRIGRHLDAARANYAEADASGRALLVLQEWRGGAVSVIGERFPLAALGPRVLADHLSGAPVVVDDIATDPRFDAGNRPMYEGIGVAAFLSVPMVRGDEIVAVLSIQDVRPRRWRSNEVRLLREIADRTWATLERARSEERLNESEAQLSAFIENAPIAMYLSDRNGRIVRLNREMAAVLGTEVDEALGRTAADFLPPAVAAESARLDALAIGGGVHGGEIRIGDRDRYADALSVRFPVPGGEEAAERLGGFVIDLTERKRAEAELERSREALYQNEKLSALGSLLAGVSHELNNPLSIVVAQAVMLERQARDSELAERAFKIRKAADRCARIVQTFLAMARQKRPERAPVDLNAVATAALDLAEYGLRTEGIAVARAFDPALPLIAADSDQLHQIIINLVINAQHALAGQGGARTVTLTTARGPDPATVILEVADNGPGVPEAVRRRIFEPFFTTKSQGEGTGVGLSFSQGLAEAHGGRLTLMPRAGGAPSA